jgi:hypothetical protein
LNAQSAVLVKNVRQASTAHLVKKCQNLKSVQKFGAAQVDARNAPAKAERLAMVVPLAKARTALQRRIVQLVQASLLHAIALENLKDQQGVVAQKAARAQSARTVVMRVDAHLAVVVALKNLVPHHVMQSRPALDPAAVLHAVKANALPANAVPAHAAALD